VFNFGCRNSRRLFRSMVQSTQSLTRTMREGVTRVNHDDASKALQLNNK
jgi:hypothetical protein